MLNDKHFLRKWQHKTSAVASGNPMLLVRILYFPIVYENFNILPHHMYMYKCCTSALCRVRKHTHCTKKCLSITPMLSEVKQL